ncbi:MAG: MCP four helix bundle domain-containing protein [Acidobacteria bacterium]|nr:MCP four helix bundle domain-containing protein [Acidobacteriota bacterium]
MALFLGFGLICAIWLFAGYYFTGRMADLEQRAAAVNERYMRAQELLTTARSQVLLGSVYVRDALLDPNPASSDEYRTKLEEASRTAEEALQRYVPVLDAPAERERIVRLRGEVEDFRKTVLEVLATDSRRWLIEARTLIRSRIMPRREGVIRVAEEMQALNRSAFVQQQSEIAGLYRLTQRRLWASFGLAVVASLGIALMAAIYAGRLEDRIQRQRQKERENARDLQRLSSQLLTAQEEERRTIARELHDEIGQALTALKVELAVAERAVEAAVGPVHALQDARTIADGALHSVRDLSHLLHPALLDDLGLAAAVDGYLKGFGTRHGLRAELLTDRMEDRLAPETEAAAYRIIQEALTNVVKHARARTCRVYLQRLTNTLLVTVEDDGVGFEPSELNGAGASRGLGLIGIRERVSHLRGTVRLESAVGRGTHLTVELPIRTRPIADATAEVDSSHTTGLAAGGVSHG